MKLHFCHAKQCCYGSSIDALGYWWKLNLQNYLTCASKQKELMLLWMKVSATKFHPDTRNSLYICVENSWVWCNRNFGTILLKNNRDEMLSDNNYNCILSYEDLNYPSTRNCKNIKLHAEYAQQPHFMRIKIEPTT